MRDHPDTVLMLKSARRTLLEQVLPRLEGEAQGAALMVARVLSVALARLATDQHALAVAERGAEPPALVALAELLGEEAGERRSACGGSATAAEAALSGKLVSAIRAGAFDPPGCAHDALLRYLMELTRGKLAESNPKALEHIGRAGGEEGA